MRIEIIRIVLPAILVLVSVIAIFTNNIVKKTKGDKNKEKNHTIEGMAIGMYLGAVVGILLLDKENLAIGMSIGMLLGVIIGMNYKK